jgi:transcriptional regulator with XRE-family HTH domain
VAHVPAPNQLGAYLRARREIVTPEAVGLPAAGTRRVAGLRREEVALLAGISSDYYLRLEQGRDRNPSAQVLDSLARVLQLDQAGTDYLHELAAPARRRRRRARRESVPAGIGQLLGTLGLPAFVEGRYFDVLAANRLAPVLSPNLQAGYNRLRSVFLDAGERDLFPDWEQVTVRHVAAFRNSVGTDTDDPRFVELVGELSLESDRFRRLWARQDVQTREGMPIRMRHPQVGELTVLCEKLAISGAPGQTLVVYHARPGTSSAEKLTLLATLADQPDSAAAAATSRRPRQRLAASSAVEQR